MKSCSLKIFLAAALLLGVAFGTLLVVSPIEPVAWTPPPLAPLEGPYAPNDRLKSIEWWARQLVGPESVTISEDGALWVGLKDGRIVRLRIGKDEAQWVANTGGRPLALERHPDGRMIVTDAHKGLLALDASGKIETLATSLAGVPFRFVDDLAITKSGVIYFTDASARHPIERFTEDLLEHGSTGRVLKYVPESRQLSLVADGLSFPNGIALSRDESFLVVAETAAYRLWRIPLIGAAKGEKHIFTDSLPGFPDNVRRAVSRKGFWVAIGSPRQAALDALASWPTIRKAVAALPKAFQPKPARHAYVLRVDENGKPVESFQHDAPESYSPIAGVTEADGFLYLGSFSREGIARFKLP